jgi:hypothetical protein
VLGLQHDSDEVVGLGVDLLVAGPEGPAVVALGSLPAGERWVDVEELARAALDELGLPLPSPISAGWELARYWATGLERGGPQSYDQASALWGLWRTLGGPPEIAALVQVMDAWEGRLHI